VDHRAAPGHTSRTTYARARSRAHPEIALVGEAAPHRQRAAAGTGTVRLTVSCPCSGRYAVVARLIEGRLGGRYNLEDPPIMVAAECRDVVACAATTQATERARGECARRPCASKRQRGSGASRAATRHVVPPRAAC
jgi:hypothetical protein